MSEMDLMPYIFTCCRNKDIDALETLIASGTDINQQNFRKETALYYAAHNGDLDIVNLLLDHGADINMQQFLGRTPLLGAVIYGRLNVVKELIKRGASFTPCHLGWTPLHDAAASGRIEIIEELLQHQDLQATVGKETLIAGETHLHLASRLGHFEAVKLLLDNCDEQYLNIKDKQGHTALEVAKTEQIRDYILNYEFLPLVKSALD